MKANAIYHSWFWLCFYVSERKYQLVVSEKAVKRLKMRLKWATRKTLLMTFDERIAKTHEIQRGWLVYFRGASIKTLLSGLDGWLRIKQSESRIPNK